MNRLNTLRVALIGICAMLAGCSPIQTPINNQYQLTCYSHHKLAAHKTSVTLLVSKPAAMTGYQTEQMLYVAKPYQLAAFAHNAWVSPPASMLYPLLLQSIQTSGYFAAVASGPYADKADYRLDTQLIEMQQNFLAKPSVLEFVIKVTLTRIDETRMVASRTFYQRVPCVSDTPYGGVMASNRATTQFTQAVTKFVISSVEQDKKQ